MDYLLSYPRTGNSFIRYAIEFVSKKPSYDYGKNINDQYDTNIQYTDTTSFCIRKEHFVVDIPEEPNKVVVLVRDFKDVFISHHFRDVDFDKDKIMKTFMTSIDGFWKDYYELLFFYDIFSKEKVMIYYDDIFKSEKTLVSIFDFLGLTDYNDFIDNFEYHKDYFFEKYKEKEGSKSEGFSNLYNIYTSSQISEMNAYFRRGNPELFDKYLKRFVSI